MVTHDREYGCSESKATRGGFPGDCRSNPSRNPRPVAPPQAHGRRTCWQFSYEPSGDLKTSSLAASCRSGRDKKRRHCTDLPAECRAAGRSRTADEVVGPKGPLRNYKCGIRSTARWPLADERHGDGKTV